MELQYISDNAGNYTAVIIPINEWNDITSKHEDLKDLVKSPILTKVPASKFKGILTVDEADKYHHHIKQARNEWERDI